MWTYKFSQLKGSSDDNRSKLRLHFHSAENPNNVETRVRYVLINSFFYKFPSLIKWCHTNMKLHVVYTGKYYSILRPI